MNLVFLGPPGAGKGTQAKLLAAAQGYAHISTGDMLRAAVREGSALGKKVQVIMDAGQLVPDALIVDIIRERIQQPDCAQGYILDGFPRTVPQAEALAQMLQTRGEKLTSVVFFSVTSQDLEARLAHRRGAEARADDSLETQRERLRVYEEQTAPLVAYYDKTKLLQRVDASGSVEQVQKVLLQTLRLP